MACLSSKTDLSLVIVIWSLSSLGPANDIVQFNVFLSASLYIPLTLISSSAADSSDMVVRAKVGDRLSAARRSMES